MVQGSWLAAPRNPLAGAGAEGVGLGQHERPLTWRRITAGRRRRLSHDASLDVVAAGSQAAAEPLTERAGMAKGARPVARCVHAHARASPGSARCPRRDARHSTAHRTTWISGNADRCEPCWRSGLSIADLCRDRRGRWKATGRRHRKIGDCRIRPSTLDNRIPAAIPPGCASLSPSVAGPKIGKI